MRITQGSPAFHGAFPASLLVALALTFSLTIFDSVRTVNALPANNRTIGLSIGTSGWSYGTIAVYRGTTVTMFLRSDDTANHQLVINTPTPITSPVIPSSAEVIMFSFLATPAGNFSYCDSGTAVCGVFQIKIPGDVNGDNAVNGFDLGLIGASFLTSLSPNWNPADQVYPDGRVDNTDFLILGFYYLTTCPPCPWSGTPYNPDINGDGFVNILDLSIVGQNFGRTASAPFNDPNQGPDINYDNNVNGLDIGIVGANFLCTPATCP